MSSELGSPSPGAGPEPHVGVLALQGSFPLHARALERCGARVRLVRRPEDLREVDALVLPGGESTTQHILGTRTGVLDAIRERGSEGLPLFGTCAGAILLGRGEEYPPRLDLLPVTALRNAYGRQVDSFATDISAAPLDEPFHAVFIRAPKFRVDAPDEVEVLAEHGGDPVLLRSGAVVISSFHPELTDDLRLHRWFLENR